MKVINKRITFTVVIALFHLSSYSQSKSEIIDADIEYYEATTIPFATYSSMTITAHSNAKVESGENVLFSAREINLLPSFEALPGAEFEAISLNTKLPIEPIKEKEELEEKLKKGTEVLSENLQEGFILAPNPSKGMVFVTIGTTLSNTTIEIYNINGAMVYSERPEFKKININTSNWIPGVYLVNIIGDNVFSQKKLVVQ